MQFAQVQLVAIYYLSIELHINVPAKPAFLTEDDTA